MSLSFGSSKKKSSSTGKQDPWAPTIPYLENYLGKVGDLSSSLGGATPGQTSAYTELTDLYSGGSPFTGQISELASDTLEGVPSQSGTVQEAYGRVNEALNPYVSGEYLNMESNPYIQGLLSTVGDQISERVNSQFAGAGRDLSGMNQKALARGISEGQLPILFNQFNQQQANQLGAANALAGISQNTAQVSQGLDQAALSGRAGGVPIAEASLASEAWGPENLFNLEQIFKDLPAQDLATIGSLLFPAAQLGQQQQSTGKESGTSVGFGANLLSDERFKEDLEEIGQLADGTPIYRFRYKGEDTTRIGVSAQDMEQITPEAVNEYAPNGGEPVKYVNMDAATQRSAEMMRPPMGGVPSGAPMGNAPRAPRLNNPNAQLPADMTRNPMLDYEMMRKAA
jgi:hypothetical protein